MTYRNCKKLIENVNIKGAKTADFIIDMAGKLDIFLLNNRITKDEYNELSALLNPAETI